MSLQPRLHLPFYCRLSLLIVALSGLAPGAKAQIVTDGSLGARQSLSGPNFQISANLGRQLGSNLFHSFQDFQLQKHQSATFSGPASIKNVLSRVTGGQGSLINGRLNCDIAGANFFFLNPSGVVFGPNVQLNVTGDFVATTASQVRLGSGNVFGVQNLSPGLLSSASPAAFGFLVPRPQSIQIRGGSLTSAPGQSISLIGGDINMHGGEVVSEQGVVNLISVNGPGEVKISGDPSGALDVGSFSSLGNFNMSGDAAIFAFEKGKVVVRAQNLRMTGAGTNISHENAQARSSGGTDIKVRGDLRIERGAFVQSRAFGSQSGAPVLVEAQNVELSGGGQIFSISEGSGRGGAIRIQAPNLSLVGGASIGSSTRASGAGGTIRIDSEAVLLDGQGQNQSTSLSTNTAGRNEGGKGGNISLNASTLRVLNGSEISAETSGSGTSGNIVVKADGVVLDGGGNASRTGITAGSGAQGITGNGGNIRVQSDTLDIRNGSVIATDARGSGIGGSIRIESEVTRIDGQSGSGTGISAVTFEAQNGGNAGNISIEGKSLEIRSGGIVTTSTFGSGAGGNVSVETNSVLLDGIGNTSPTSITAETSAAAPGRGGAIHIKTKALQVRSGAEISSSTFGRGAGGSVVINADSVLLDGGKSDKFTGLNAATFLVSQGGRGGNIEVESQDVRIVNGAGISAGTLGTGVAGGITLRAGKVLINRGESSRFTGISGSTNASFPGEEKGGRGSEIILEGQSLQILNGGEISSDTLGDGEGGNLTVKVESILLDGQGSANATGLSAGSALEKDGGRGGNINIETRTLDIRNLANLSSATEGSGLGGNITVNAQNILLSGGGVSAASQGSGKAGKVELRTSSSVILENNSFVEAAAPNSNGEDVIIRAGEDLLASDSTIASFAGLDGGGIQLRSGRLLRLRNSELQAQAGGTGGNINIDSRFAILDRSRGEADAIRGNGGNITIRSRVFLSSIESILSASSELALAGNIAIQSPNTNVGGSLLVLPSTPLSAESYLAERCVIRNTGASSSFTVAPQYGTPTLPGDLLPSPAFSSR